MCKTDKFILVFFLSVSYVRGHIIWEAPDQLQPVHGLYVKPSIDGTTGDLYVAATEDNGIKSEWLTDQPVNFLPPKPKKKPKTVPISLTSSVTKTKSPQEETITTQKRVEVTSPTLKYAYGLPIPGIEENVPMFPFPIPTSSPSEQTLIPPCSTNIPAPPFPLPYFYPHIMSAIAQAMNSYKVSDGSEENTSIPTPPPYWPHTFGYPYQYILLDPNMWPQSHTKSLEAQSSNSSEST